jgi:hypothetical protein
MNAENSVNFDNDSLSQEPSNIDGKQLCQETMDRLAMPLLDGTPSPFSSHIPLTFDDETKEIIALLATIHDRLEERQKANPMHDQGMGRFYLERAIASLVKLLPEENQ